MMGKYICAIIFVIKIRSVQAQMDFFSFEIVQSSLFSVLNFLYFFSVVVVLIIRPLFLFLLVFCKVFIYLFLALWLFTDLLFMIFSLIIISYSSTNTCQRNQDQLVSFVFSLRNYQNNHFGYKILRLMNVDFYGDMRSAINNWTSKNCDIGSSWGGTIIIIYFVLELLIFIEFIIVEYWDSCTCCGPRRVENAFSTSEGVDSVTDDINHSENEEEQDHHVDK
jgi:hypothetical protein